MNPYLKSAISRSSLLLDAIKGNESKNKFVFAVDGKDYGVAVIKSAGSNKIRLFRGFQARQGERWIPIQDKLYHEIIGVHSCLLAVYDSDQGLIDKIEFKAKIEKDMDAALYNFRMETVIIRIEKIV